MLGSELRWPNWVGIVVEDIQAQRAFYREVLGFKELLVGDGWVQFDMGFPNVLELLERSAEPQYDRPRYQVGYAVEDIRSAREELVARGATPISEIEGEPESNGYWTYFRDPEGNVFEISQRLGSEWV
jgi:predicted enzyme related to lactoylglutathione lyase